MIIIYSTTAFLILLYLAYPFCLNFFSYGSLGKEKETDNISSVSLILLSYNGKDYLKEKIFFLLKELSFFPDYELIIIDDNSTDESNEILNNFKDSDNIKVICKTVHKGIPNSMNIGVNNAKYEHIIFCDQRQSLSDNIIRHILEPLKYKNVGAVSACISHIAKNNKNSVIRRHENILKSKESEIGNLIGVYGPFYAIKKQCYAVIPDYIILDDLYLSLRILKTKQIEISKDCKIIDENISVLYDYKRTRRYITGFLQILKEKTIISDLDFKQKLMLLWHKYLRLLIPVFIFISYICIGINITQGLEYLILFSILTALGLISVLPYKFNSQFKFTNLIRINILYFVALFDVIINDILFNGTVNSR